MLLPQAGGELGPKWLRVLCWKPKILEIWIRYTKILHQGFVFPVNMQVHIQSETFKDGALSKQSENNMSLQNKYDWIDTH